MLLTGSLSVFEDSAVSGRQSHSEISRFQQKKSGTPRNFATARQN
jgi:hypothetical protein